MALSPAQQARVIVDNALKLYSQDKTGMVDFALESGGESAVTAVRRPPSAGRRRRSQGLGVPGR